MPRPPHRWTLEEDRILSKAVHAQLAHGTVKDWTAVASEIPGRTNKDCRKRWHNALAAGRNKGYWTPEEDCLLERGVRLHGETWTEVAAIVSTRTADQCAKRWKQCLDPQLDHSEWTEAESCRLLEAVCAKGRRWKQIQVEYFPARSRNSIKNQFTIVTRRRMKSQNKNDEIAPKDGALGPDSGAIQLKHQAEDEMEIDDDDGGDDDEDEVQEQDNQGGYEKSEEDVSYWEAQGPHSSSAEVVASPSFDLAQITPNIGSPDLMYEPPWDIFTEISQDALYAALRAGPDFDLRGIALGDSDFEICTSMPMIEGLPDPQQDEMMGETNNLPSLHPSGRAEVPISTNQSYQRVESAHYTARSASDASKVVLTIEEPDTMTVNSLLQVAVASNSRFHFERQ
ncbi:hypothetical protein BO94DRAFT_622366 [Aspergillus sclerotioniger CBS 115572]|uniref:Myb-like transcription factor n=1 Tax=Aspergillus sclerotioniger CBS 115572 TaxID=1450535 RepID=A0A317X6F0_9EURO|nr:hypothetical protein BO94DRAFT_622366 [Aspergillus sclerotioniger CBS 115572]PWY93212.1 hypothetical protein BO94DRAFT_622366 [Aspergillus sclerotioniger CBS 115572]